MAFLLSVFVLAASLHVVVPLALLIGWFAGGIYLLMAMAGVMYAAWESAGAVSASVSVNPESNNLALPHQANLFLPLQLNCYSGHHYLLAPSECISFHRSSLLLETPSCPHPSTPT